MKVELDQSTTMTSISTIPSSKYVENSWIDLGEEGQQLISYF